VRSADEIPKFAFSKTLNEVLASKTFATGVLTLA
jgi:hypothetical protein